MSRGFYMISDALQGGDLNEYFVERFIDKGRHVETQCGRDTHVPWQFHRPTRDCSCNAAIKSWSRPGAFLPDTVMEQLARYSRNLFEAVGYDWARESW